MHICVKRTGQFQHACVALKYHLLPGEQAHRQHRGIGEIREVHDHPTEHIHLIFVADFGKRHRHGFLSRHKTHRPKCIDPDIGQRPATGFGAVADIIRRILVIIRKRHIGMAQGANRPTLHQRAGADELRVMHDHIGLCGQQPAGITGGDQLIKLPLGHRNRLFTQHMLASGQRFQHPFDMQVIGQRDVNRVHVRISQQRLITGMHRHARLKGQKPRGLGRIGRRNRHQIGPACGMNRRGHVTQCKICRPKNAPTHRFDHDIPPNFDK